MRIFIIIFLFPFISLSQDSLNMSLLGYLDYPNTNGIDIWGYVDSSGNEYAIVGLRDGVSFVDVTDPTNPDEKFFIPDIYSIWRDIKTWNNYAYVTTESDTGLLIIDLNDLSGNTYWHVKDFIGDNSIDTIHFEAAHNLYIDENGIAYIFGASNPPGYPAPPNGAIFLDLNSNPINPTYLGNWNDHYIHDGMVRNDTLWAACVYYGSAFCIDVLDKTSPNILASVNTPNSFTHNVWPSDDGNYIYTTDEQGGAFITAYNVEDLNNIYEVDRLQTDPGSNSIPHNSFVDGNFLVTSYYTNGTVVYDITHPQNMVEVAYYDSYLGSGWGFYGCWGTYPYLPSGNIISSDINSGSNGGGKLLIYSREFQQACQLEGSITDQSNGNPISNASVSIINTNFTSSSNLNGFYQTSTLDSGYFHVVFSAFGYENDTLGIYLSNGIISNLNASLNPTCNFPKPDSLHVFDIIDTRVKVGWKNMNSSECRVLKYYVRFREVGSPNWITRSAGSGSGLCNFGLNNTDKQLINLSPSTTYECKMKAFYCGGGSSGYSSPIQFITADPCPDMINLTASTFNFNPGKVRFDWSITNPYVFARVKYRIDTANSIWQNVGGFGIYYPLSNINAFGLLPGNTYRAHGRLFCDSNITAYRSISWTNPPIFWTQPNSPIREGIESETNGLEVFPNPSDGNFNIVYNINELTNFSITITNVIGEKVYQENYHDYIGEINLNIALKSKSSSIYFLNIVDGSYTQTKKIIIK